MKYMDHMDLFPCWVSMHQSKAPIHPSLFGDSPGRGESMGLSIQGDMAHVKRGIVKTGMIYRDIHY